MPFIFAQSLCYDVTALLKIAVSFYFWYKFSVALFCKPFYTKIKIETFAINCSGISGITVILYAIAEISFHFLQGEVAFNN
jgi:hypothetical protein